MNQTEWGSLGTILVLGGLWAIWTEYRLRATLSELRKVQDEKKELMAKDAVHALSDSDLDTKLSKDIGPGSKT